VTDVIRFAVLGLGLGAMYALAGQGIIVIYRGSGVINFALGAIGTAAAYLAWELQNAGWPFGWAFVAGVALSAVLGVAIQTLVMRPMRRGSSLVRLVATLGVLVLLQSFLTLRYDGNVTLVASPLPTTLLRPFGGAVVINEDRLWLLAIAILVTVLLWCGYRWTNFGRATTAVAENPRAASSLGWSPDLIATANWGLGCALAGAAGILLAPVISLQVAAFTSLVLAALAAALVGGFSSFPITLAAGLLIGIITSELTRFSTTPGLADTVPFFVIVVMVVISGRALPIRGYLSERLPKLGTGRLRPALVVPAAVVVFVLITQIRSATWADATITTFGVATILLSIVVVTGYAGQISLAQYAFAGVGALIAGRLVATTSVPFEAALLIGVVGTVPIGLLFALPAVRTRGVKLAIITLGLGAAVDLMVFENPNYTGGLIGTNVGVRHLFGLNIDGVTYPQRYAAFVFVLFVLAAVAVTNLRRGRAGRRLIAVRTNERAAAALGISPWSVKLYAFGLAAAIAALGGILLSFSSDNIVYSGFVSFQSITAMGQALIGGIGFVMGPVIGAMFVPGSLGAKVLAFPSEWLPFIAGGVLILILLIHPDGVAPALTSAVRSSGRRLASLSRRLVRERSQPTRERPLVTDAALPQPAPDAALPQPAPDAGRAQPTVDAVLPQPNAGRAQPAPDGTRASHERLPARTLEVHDLHVRYSGVVAVDGVSLTVAPGEVVGLIGSNGSGKTTVIDAITGFTRPAGGRVLLDAQLINRWSAARRSRAGISRSFQSLELFDELTVRDNLRTAADRRDLLAYITDIVRPATPRFAHEVSAAIEDFELAGELDHVAKDLPYSRRRLLAVARAVATGPSILLLDEPAAGLGEDESGELRVVIRQLVEGWGMGILIAEHDVDLVMNVCDRIVVLDAGRVISEGVPQEVQTDPAVIAAYLGTEVVEAPWGQAPEEPPARRH
jgi:ABC-type branched-subunit amino acid transport system ATPase component/branched-subunit amino acid ABC-type transport system permease component